MHPIRCFLFGVFQLARRPLSGRGSPWGGCELGNQSPLSSSPALKFVPSSPSADPHLGHGEAQDDLPVQPLDIEQVDVRQDTILAPWQGDGEGQWASWSRRNFLALQGIRSSSGRLTTVRCQRARQLRFYLRPHPVQRLLRTARARCFESASHP